MKSLDEFFENINFEFLSLDNPLEKDYYKLWEDIYMPSQEKKIIENNIKDDVKLEAFNGLSKRGKFLCEI